MLRVFVDSGSSIKQNEKSNYNVEIIPLKILLGDKEYLDGVDLTNEVFYDYLQTSKVFPKTSLPNLDEVEKQVTAFTSNGDDVIIITISSEISGTYNSMRLLFGDNSKVRIIDSRLAVGGMRIIVEEINKNRDKDLDSIVSIVNDLIPRIRVAAIPETLEFLHRGGRLGTKDYLLGSALRLKPIIGFEGGKVKMVGKAIGLRRAMMALVALLEKEECDLDYSIVPSMTNNRENLDTLISLTPEKYHKVMTVTDDLDHAIAAHWGPNAFGYIFVSKNKK